MMICVFSFFIFSHREVVSLFASHATMGNLHYHVAKNPVAASELRLYHIMPHAFIFSGRGVLWRETHSVMMKS
jgi:hypothetical protein